MNGKNKLLWCPAQMIAAVDHYLRNVLLQSSHHGFKVEKVDMDGGDFEITITESDLPGPQPGR